MRLFIAIELPRSFKAELARMQRELKALSSGGKFVPKENFHLTLHFIGESADLLAATKAMHEAVRGIRPFVLRLGGCGSFERKEGRTAYIEVLGDMGELKVLYDSLEGALYDQGFSRERKRFTPHVTMARSVALDELAQAELSAFTPNAEVTVNSITLFESRREEGRMVYLPLHREKF